MTLSGLNSPQETGDLLFNGLPEGNAFRDALNGTGDNLNAQSFNSTANESTEGNQLRLQAGNMRDEAEALRDEADALRRNSAEMADPNAAGRTENQALALENKANALDLEADQTDMRAQNADQRIGVTQTASSVVSGWDSPSTVFEFETALSKAAGFEDISVSATRTANENEVYSLLDLASSMGASGTDLVDVQAYAELFPIQFVFVDGLIENYGSEVATGRGVAVLNTTTVLLDSSFEDIDFTTSDAGADPSIAVAGQAAVEYAMTELLDAFDFVSNSDLLSILGGQISDLDAFITNVDEKIDGVGKTVSSTDATVTRVDEKIDGVGKTVSSTDATVTRVDEKIDGVGETVNRTDATVTRVDEKIDGLAAESAALDANEDYDPVAPLWMKFAIT